MSHTHGHHKRASGAPAGGGDGRRESRGQRATADTHPTGRRESVPLRQKDTNVPASQKKQTAQLKKGATAQPKAKAQAATPAQKSASGRIMIKARGRYNARNIAELLSIERQRSSAFRKFMRGDRNRLLTSFMPGDDNTSPDFMNFLNLGAFGNYERMYTHVAFGESDPIDLLIDTGSHLTWVNKTSYTEALARHNAQPAEPVADMRFKMSYGGGSGTIDGDIVMDKVKLSDATHGDASLTFAFGVVDETKCPDAKRWRTGGQDIKGILALGTKEMGRGTVQTKKEDGEWKSITLPTIMEKLLEKGLISENIIGIHLQLPHEGKRQADDSSSVSSGSDAGTMDAEFHLGRLNTSICTISTFKWIPATTVGTAARFCGLDVELKYGDKVVMAESPGIMDTGAGMISLPETVLDEWLASVNEGREIVKYDTDEEIYHIKKADFGKLKPIEFKFTKGSNAVFKFKPRQQVYPPTIFRKVVREDKGDHLYFVFRKKLEGESGSSRFSLGLFWMMWYYVVLDPSDANQKKVGIAEIPNHTDHRWRGL